MKLSKALIYILMIMGVYTLICGVEYIAFKSLVEALSLNYYIKLILVIIVGLIINPFITYYLSEKIPFNNEKIVWKDED